VERFAPPVRDGTAGSALPEGLPYLNIDKPVKKPNQSFYERQSKKIQRQGARIPRTEAYFWYAGGTREEGQRSIGTFYFVVNIGFEFDLTTSGRKGMGSII